jgi:hypothetical protein
MYFVLYIYIYYCTLMIIHDRIDVYYNVYRMSHMYLLSIIRFLYKITCAYIYRNEMVTTKLGMKMPGTRKTGTTVSCDLYMYTLYICIYASCPSSLCPILCTLI